MKVAGVEGFYHKAVQYPFRKCERNRRTSLRSEPPLFFRVVSAQQDSAHIASGEAVHPRDRIFVIHIAFSAEFEEGFERPERHDINFDPGTCHSLQLNIGPGDQPGEPKPPDGCREHVGILLGIAQYEPIVRALEAELENVASEGSGAMMVLSMNIIRDGSTDSDKARSGCDREKPALRKKGVNDIGECDTAFTAKHAAVLIECEKSVQAPAIDEMTARVQARVSVAPAETIGEYGARTGRAQNFPQLVVPCRAVHMLMFDPRIPPPRQVPVRPNRGRGCAP